MLKPDLGPMSKVNLDVQTISFADRSGIPPANSPYNSNRFQPTIAEAIRQWSSDHLQAVGTYGNAIVIVKDASLTLQTIPYQKDWFTRQQSAKYIGHASVDIELKGRGDIYALASAEATHYETLPEDPTDAERQNAYVKVLNGLMHDLAHNIDTSIHDHMQNFVITAPIMDNGPTPSMMMPTQRPSSYPAP